jgi:hypothetical protein
MTDTRAYDQAMRDDYAPVCAAMTDKIGAAFTVDHAGGGCLAIHAYLEGGQLMLITDYEDGDLSHTHEGRGYWVGIYSPDPEWGYQEDLRERRWQGPRGGSRLVDRIGRVWMLAWRLPAWHAYALRNTMGSRN